MRNYKVKASIWLLLGFSATVWVAVAAIQGLDPSKFSDLVRLLPTVVSIDLFAYWVFSRVLWKWPIFQGWLVPFPNLNGTWQGAIETTWKDGDEKPVSSVPVTLTIKQSFGRISCVMRTAEMESRSFVEGFCLDPEAQVRQLCYSYASKPRIAVRERSATHEGTALLNILGRPVDKLQGEYWTDRRTTGSFTLAFRTRELLDELPSDLPRHPMGAREGRHEAD